MAKTVGTKTELAALLGLSQARISQLVKMGLPVRKSGKVDLQEAAEWYKANFPGESATPEVDFMISRAKKEAALAGLREHELAEKRAKVIDAEEYRVALSSMITRSRSILLAIGEILADRLATISDPVKIRELIDEEVYRALSELAEYPKKENS